jgi:hypothetical protein
VDFLVVLPIVVTTRLPHASSSAVTYLWKLLHRQVQHIPEWKWGLCSPHPKGLFFSQGITSHVVATAQQVTLSHSTGDHPFSFLTRGLELMPPYSHPCSWNGHRSKGAMTPDRNLIQQPPKGKGAGLGFYHWPFQKRKETISLGTETNHSMSHSWSKLPKHIKYKDISACAPNQTYKNGETSWSQQNW